MDITKIMANVNRPIVVDGADGSGKSTLIAECFPDALHMGGPPKTREELRERLHMLEPGRVYDRWTGISELVYGTIIRGNLLVPRSEFNEAIKKYRPIVIYCRPPPKVMFQNLKRQVVKPHKDREFIFKIIKNANQIHAMYDNLMDSVLPKLGCVVFKYDYTHELHTKEGFK